MKRNIGPADRAIRAVVGVFLAVAAFFVGAAWLQIALWVAAGILLFTALTGFCLLYVPFGIDTNRAPRLKEESQGDG